MVEIDDEVSRLGAMSASVNLEGIYSGVSQPASDQSASRWLALLRIF